MTDQAAAEADMLPIPSQPATTPPKPKSIALITCSTRPGRINPAITSYISSLLPISTSVILTTIDIDSFALPLLNEPDIPATQDKSNPTPGYTHSHTQAWSAEIRKHDAFIFVTPQYNWSMPASIKNAIDYLFWEWVGKGAAVVSYGGHGGGKGRAALEQVCQGCRMRVLGMGVELKVDPRVKAVVNGKLIESVRESWKGQGVEERTRKLWEGVLGLLMDGEESKEAKE